MTASSDAGGVFFELNLLSPDTALLATVRRFVGELSGRVLADADVTSKIVLATHELLDNAIRHAAKDESGIRVELRRPSNFVDVVIVTKNRAADERRRVLELLLGEMHACSDRADYYQKLLDRVARRTDGAGLGLGRVYAESELDLSVRFEEGIVTTRAEGRLALAKGLALR